MGSVRVSGTEGYANAAEALLKTRLPFQDLHRPILHLIPRAPGRILDVGSGPGHDAAAFATMGHRVVAVEPTEQLQLPAMALHSSPLIEWLDDSLPHLRSVAESGDTFDLVMLSAVWMHLDERQRQTAMPVVASILTASGTLIMSLHHGPVPSGRRMFEVTAEETIELARAAGLRPVINVRTDSVQLTNRAAGVTCTRLAFVPSTQSL
jgi:SAM-dependent methyltransferase